jgi:hypothetical protein
LDQLVSLCLQEVVQVRAPVTCTARARFWHNFMKTSFIIIIIIIIIIIFTLPAQAGQ